MQANDAQRPLASIVSFPDVDVDAPASVQASVPVDGTARVCEITPAGVISSIKIPAALEVVPERRRQADFHPSAGQRVRGRSKRQYRPKTLARA